MKFTHLLIASLVSLVSTSYLLLFQKTLSNFTGDILLAMPIAKAIAKPELYSKSDLLIQSGLKVPFHTYKLAGFLYRNNLDLERIWFVLCVVFVFFLFVCLWYFSYNLTRHSFVAVISTLTLAYLPSNLGTLNWSFLPPSSLVSSTFVLPLAFLAVTLWQRNRILLALVSAAISYNFHPLGLIPYISITAFLWMGTKYNLKRRFIISLISFAFLIPTAFYTYTSLPQNFGAISSEMKSKFWEYYRLFAYHAYIEDHYREGYFWFFTHLGGAIFFSGLINYKMQRWVRWFVFSLLCLLVGYVLNLYVIKIVPLTLMYLFRVTYFLKPLLVSLVVYGLFCFLFAKSHVISLISRILVVGLLASSLIIKNLPIAELLAFAGYSILLLSLKIKHVRVLGIGVVMILAISLLPGFSEIRLGLGLLMSIVFTLYPTRVSFDRYLMPKLRDSWIIGGLIALLLLPWSPYLLSSLKMKQLRPIQFGRRMYFSQITEEQDASLLGWIKTTPQDSYFLIPPEDNRDTGYFFLQFRLVAERGVFFSAYDINQLAYDVRGYLKAMQRFSQLGFESKGRHKFNFDAYNSLGLEQLRYLNIHEGVDYAIFEKSKFQGKFLAEFENDHYKVLNLTKL